MVKIRLTRTGRRNAPFYTIVATDERSPRDGKFLQKLGFYNPKTKDNGITQLDKDAVVGWIAKGAQLSDTINSLFKKNGIKL